MESKGAKPKKPSTTHPFPQKRKEVEAMQWELVVALVIAVPVILFPVAYVWYINIGGIIAAIKRVRERRAVHNEDGPVQEMEYNRALTEALERYPWDK